MFGKKKKNALEMNEDYVIGVTTVPTTASKNLENFFIVGDKNEETLVMAVIILVNDDFNGDYYLEKSKSHSSLQFRTKTVLFNAKNETYIKQNGKKKVLSLDTVKKISKRQKQLKKKLG